MVLKPGEVYCSKLLTQQILLFCCPFSVICEYLNIEKRGSRKNMSAGGPTLHTRVASRKSTLFWPDGHWGQAAEGHKDTSGIKEDYALLFPGADLYCLMPFFSPFLASVFCHRHLWVWDRSVAEPSPLCSSSKMFLARENYFYHEICPLWWGWGPVWPVLGKLEITKPLQFSLSYLTLPPIRLLLWKSPKVSRMYLLSRGNSDANILKQQCLTTAHFWVGLWWVSSG